MPIRIRYQDKTVQTLPDSAIFVELVNDFGEVLAVATENPKTKSFKFFDGDSISAKKYMAFFKVPFVRQTIKLNEKDLNALTSNK
jgi:hypothetical protein